MEKTRPLWLHWPWWNAIQNGPYSTERRSMSNRKKLHKYLGAAVFVFLVPFATANTVSAQPAETAAAQEPSNNVSAAESPADIAASKAEIPSNEAPLSSSNDAASNALDERINDAEENQQALIVINSADESGYSAEVVNGSAQKEGNTVLVEAPTGETETLPTSKTLTTGEIVDIEYSVEGNQITAKYSTDVDPGLTGATVVRPYSTAGCAGSILLGGAATTASAIGVVFAPVTGPIGPAMAAVTMATASGSIISAADACGLA